jgi:hypothetical protein
MPNQQQIVKSIAAMAKRLGRAPSLLEFVTGARIPKNSIFRLFPRWNDASGPRASSRIGCISGQRTMNS